MKVLFLLLAELLGQPAAHAEDPVLATWSCVPLRAQAARTDAPSLRVRISRFDPSTLADYSHPYFRVSDEHMWRLWPDGRAELTTRFSTSDDVGRPRRYACGSTYRQAALLRFLSVVRETRLCSQREHRSDGPPGSTDERTTVYQVDMDAPGLGKCHTFVRMEGWPVRRKLLKVLAGWAAFEQSICGACQLPAEAGYRRLYDYRRLDEGYR